MDEVIQILKEIISKKNLKLTPDQKHALEICCLSNYDRVLVLGSAGTGKSTVIEIIKEFYENIGLEVCLIAPTGVAAIKIEGKTIHSVFKINGEKGPIYGFPMMKKICNELKNISLFILDEISMVTPEIAEYILEIIKMIDEENEEPVKLYAFGDLFQLPPVIKNNEKLKQYFQWERGAMVYADPSMDFLKFSVFHPFFQNESFYPIILHYVVRQNDKEFVNLLEKIKYGHYPANINRMFEHMNVNQVIECLLNEDDAVFACAKNDVKNKINNLIVSRLPGDGVEYLSTTLSDDPDYDEINNKKVILKENLRIMLLKNLKSENTNELYAANGQTGMIEKINEDKSVKVKFDNGKEITIIPKKKDIVLTENEEIEVTSYLQIPLIPAYALTIHKLQGATIGKLILYPKDIFEFGHLYVALSRVRSRQNLYLVNDIERKNVKSNRYIVEFYDYIERFGSVPDLYLVSQWIYDLKLKQLKRQYTTLLKREMDQDAKEIEIQIQEIERLKE